MNRTRAVWLQTTCSGPSRETEAETREPGRGKHNQHRQALGCSSFVPCQPAQPWSSVWGRAEQGRDRGLAFENWEPSCIQRKQEGQDGAGVGLGGVFHPLLCTVCLSPGTRMLTSSRQGLGGPGHCAFSQDASAPAGRCGETRSRCVCCEQRAAALEKGAAAPQSILLSQGLRNTDAEEERARQAGPAHRHTWPLPACPSHQAPSCSALAVPLPIQGFYSSAQSAAPRLNTR